MSADNIQHPMIWEAECIDLTAKGDIILCPVCREECERIYYKVKDRTHILGCEMCIDYEDATEYRFRLYN